MSQWLHYESLQRPQALEPELTQKNQTRQRLCKSGKDQRYVKRFKGLRRLLIQKGPIHILG